MKNLGTYAKAVLFALILLTTAGFTECGGEAGCEQTTTVSDADTTIVTTSDGDTTMTVTSGDSTVATKCGVKAEAGVTPD